MRSTARWVSIEGLNGVGKTYLTSRLATSLGGSCLPLSELTDHDTGRLTGQVIAALARAGRTFLRTGHPVTETFALLALKIYEYERVAATMGSDVELVLEDRGPDTVAVYQAAILAAERPQSEMQLVGRISDVAATWRPMPALTLLLVDDFDACLHRFEARLGAPLDPADRQLLARVDRLYRDLAATNPDRIRIIDRTGRRRDDVLDELYVLCRTAMKEASRT